MREDLLQMIREFPGNAGVILGDPENPGFCYQEDQKIPSASVIKLFILWELYRQTENGEKSLTDQIVLTEEMKVGGFGVLTHLTGNPSLSLHDIATLMIISSDNTATNILIDSLGVAPINATCKKMGWNETILGRKMMDFEAKAAGKDNYTSPRDTADFFKRLLSKEEEISQQGREQMLEILKGQQCNNKLPAQMNNSWPFAHKTGDLPKLEHDCGILYTAKGPKLLIVFTNELQSNSLGVEFQNKIGRWADQNWQ